MVVFFYSVDHSEIKKSGLLASDGHAMMFATLAVGFAFKTARLSRG